ncbi:UNKNOWN [Stylonychia lemnae]|uniref:Uncharacterized protein n=1 Tax=Stylonychia lemnae TaxID=5949 RepID=A0A077ZSH7_STYLE|nr:UNKNOWN [Stylonychia lemnae]|eukprot:CDW72514.1 UNKNOWN [Stylonychia lemnae]
MSSTKRQGIFKDQNPLYKLYKNEDIAHYIPHNKRHTITQYMGKVNLLMGSNTNKDDQFQSIQTSTFKKNDTTEYKETVNDRSKVSAQIKNFHLKEKMYVGNEKPQSETSGIMSQPVQELDRQKDYAEKRQVVNQLKNRLRSSNFQLGSQNDKINRQEIEEQYNKDFKEIYKQALTKSPPPHKNTSTIKMSPAQTMKFEPFTDYLDVNKMKKEALEQVERPVNQSALKQSSIRFSYNQKGKSPFSHRGQSLNYDEAMSTQGANSRGFSTKLSQTSLSNRYEEVDNNLNNSNNLHINKILKAQNEHSPRTYLTSGIGQANQPDFQTINVKHQLNLDKFDASQHKEARDLRAKMRSTTYSIGRKGEPITPQLYASQAPTPQQFSPDKQREQDYRFVNPNLIKNLNVAQAQNISDKTQRFNTMHGSYYNTFYTKGNNQVQSPIDRQIRTTKELKSELLGHAFELGFDANGGAKIPDPLHSKAASIDILNQSYGNKNAKDAFKMVAEKQNFKISQNIGKSVEVNVWNKFEGKNYGTGRPVNNIIDQEALKRSNVPFGMNTPQIVREQQVQDLNPKTLTSFSPDIINKKTNVGNFYHKIAEQFKQSKVPFSPDLRKSNFKPDESFTNSFYKTQFEWKQPKFDMSH